MLSAEEKILSNEEEILSAEEKILSAEELFEDKTDNILFQTASFEIGVSAYT